VSSSFGSLVTAIKPKPKENYRTTAMLLFYILQNIALTNVVYYLKIYVLSNGTSEL
jgi:hypothetical protein